MKIPSLVRSFIHAFRGLVLAFRMERNFRIQIGVAVIVFVCMWIFPLAAWQRVILLSISVFVLVLELLNTSIERVVDLAKPRLDAYARDVKDVMAGAVLLASIFAVMIGAVIFWPYLVGRGSVI